MVIRVLAVFVAVMMVMLWLNPATIYLRLSMGWILLGGLVLALGGAVEIYSEKIPFLELFRVSTEPNLFAGLIWFAVTILLIWADLRSRVIARNR